MLALIDEPEPWRIELTPKPETNIITPEELECSEADPIAETIRDFSFLEEEDFRYLFDNTQPFSTRSQEILSPDSFEESDQDFPSNLAVLNALVRSPLRQTGKSLYEALNELVDNEDKEMVLNGLRLQSLGGGLVFHHGPKADSLISALQGDAVFIPDSPVGSYHALNGKVFEAGSRTLYDPAQYVGFSKMLTDELKIIAD